MAIKFFWLLATKFGKGACNMCLEIFHQALHTTTKCDWKFSGQCLKITIASDWKKVSVAKLLVIKNFQLVAWQMAVEKWVLVAIWKTTKSF